MTAFLYISMLICIFGVISNVSMAILLTRPRLASTINRLMALVTLSDALLMISYLVYIVHFDLVDPNVCPVDILSYGWVLFQLLHSNVSVYLRAFSLWLSVVMAGYRKRVLSRNSPQQRRTPYTTAKSSSLAAKLAMGVGVGVLATCVPIFMQNTIVEGPRAPENDSICPRNHSPYYRLREPDYALWYDGLLLKIVYWINGLLLKLIPLVLLTFYLIRVVLLVYANHKARQRNFNFQNRQTSPPTKSSSPSGQQQPAVEWTTGGNTFRSTMMPTSLILVTILLTTVLCELPNAILSVMSGLLTPVFIRRTYLYLAEMMDLLSLFSCASTSILYFVMSRSLRRAFLRTFCQWFRFCRRIGRRRGGDAMISNVNECVMLRRGDP